MPILDGIDAIVFDLYGTLFDVHSLAARCEAAFPGQGAALSQLWRRKQLEYTWLRSLLDRYADFEQVTEEALRNACGGLGLPLADGQAAALARAYLALEPFPEVPATLAKLQALGLPLAILSNGSPRTIAAVVGSAGLGARFAALISVDGLRIYKPHPSVYELAVETLGVAKSRILFLSSNAWDASGAAAFGFRVAWLDRGGSGVFDQLGERPDAVIARLDRLLD
ncbi:MAG: haloacid dehalogenase type II [Nevskia sp.]